MQKYNKTGFTLVELIVVITILSVLATIGFISFSGYQSSARDSVRLSDIHSIQTGLGLLKAKGSKYPFPDNAVNVTSSGNILNYQGYAGVQVLGTLGVNGGGKDPLTQEYYTYVTNANRVKFQLLSYFENKENLKGKISGISKSYALGAELFPQLTGDKLGVIVNNTTKKPLQESGMDLDISQSTSTYEVYLTNEEKISGSNISLGGIYSKSSCKRLKEFDNTLKDGKYMIDPLANGNEFEVLCDMTTDGGGWTLYTGRNVYDLPNVGYLKLFPEKLNINFSEVRYNFKTPAGTQLPLIYKLFSITEGRLLLQEQHRIATTLWWDSSIHYQNSQQFSNALSFGEKNNSGINLSDFREAVIQDDISFMKAWVDGNGDDVMVMGTAFSFQKTHVSEYLWFPATPYMSTYNIGNDTFEGTSTTVAWTDNRSIAIWIK